MQQPTSTSLQPEGGSGGGWSFPRFTGHRRPLPPGDEHFEWVNLEREAALAKQVCAVLRGAELMMGMRL